MKLKYFHNLIHKKKKIELKKMLLVYFYLFIYL